MSLCLQKYLIMKIDFRVWVQMFFDFFFFSLLKFSSQIYTDLGGACGAQADEIK